MLVAQSSSSLLLLGATASLLLLELCKCLFYCPCSQKWQRSVLVEMSLLRWLPLLWCSSSPLSLSPPSVFLSSFPVVLFPFLFASLPGSLSTLISLPSLSLVFVSSLILLLSSGLLSSPAFASPSSCLVLLFLFRFLLPCKSQVSWTGN